jgi:hypothetical protein
MLARPISSMMILGRVTPLRMIVDDFEWTFRPFEDTLTVSPEMLIIVISILLS